MPALKNFASLLCIVFFTAWTVAQNDTNTVVSDSTAVTTIEAPEQMPAPAKNKLDLFAPAQYDSVMGLLPGGDSLRAGKNVVSIGTDPATGAIVVISLDAAGTPEKTIFPATSLKRKPVSASQASKPAVSKRDQNGRTWFIIESAVKSAYIYPVSFSNAFPEGNGQTIAGFSLLTIGGTLYGTYAFTKNMELGYGKVGLMNYGSTLFGSYYPALIAAFLSGTTDLDEPPQKRVTDSWGSYYEYGTPAVDKINAWCSMIGFPLGMVVGSKVNLAGKDDFGKVAVMEYLSQTLGGSGFVLPLFFMDPADDADAYLTTSSLFSMTLLPTGMAIGKYMCGDRNISAGRGSLPWVSGLLGTATGVALASLPDYDDVDGITIARIVAASGLVGYGAGTALGFTYHPTIDYSYWQTVFIGASTCAGAIMGIALPLIAQSEDRQPYILAGSIGGWTGFFLGEKLSLGLFEKSSRDNQSSSIRFELPGLAALPVMMSAKKRTASIPMGASMMPAASVANVEWRF
jgi:hypothetical protein